MNETKSKLGRRRLGDHVMDAVLHIRMMRDQHMALKEFSIKYGIPASKVVRGAIKSMLDTPSS